MRSDATPRRQCTERSSAASSRSCRSGHSGMSGSVCRSRDDRRSWARPVVATRQSTGAVDRRHAVETCRCVRLPIQGRFDRVRPGAPSYHDVWVRACTRASGMVPAGLRKFRVESRGCCKCGIDVHSGRVPLTPCQNFQPHLRHAGPFIAPFGMSRRASRTRSANQTTRCHTRDTRRDRNRCARPKSSAERAGRPPGR